MKNYQVVKVTFDVATNRSFETVHKRSLQEKSARHLADQLNEQVSSDDLLSETSNPDASTIVSYVAKPIVRE